MDSTPFDLTKPYVVNQIALRGEIRVVQLKLGESVRIQVILKTDEGKAIDAKMYLLEGEDYAKWGTSDDYIIEYVNAKLASE